MWLNEIHVDLHFALTLFGLGFWPAMGWCSGCWLINKILKRSGA